MADEIFQRAWGHYSSLIEFLLKGGKYPGIIQPYNLATLLSYSEKHERYTNFLLLNASNYVADTTPIVDNQSQLGSDIPEFPDQLIDAYEAFLFELDEVLLSMIDRTKLPEYQRLETEEKQAQTKLEDEQGIVDSKWADHLERHPEIPVAERRAERVIWERDNGHSKRIARLQGNLRKKSLRVNAFLRKNLPPEYGRVITAKDHFEDPNFWVKLPVAPGHDDVTLRDLWRPFRMQFPLVELDEFLNNDTIIDRAFDTTSEDYSRAETRWGVSTKFGWGIFSGGGNVERRKLEEITNKRHFRFHVKFQRFEEVEIWRDRWYQDILFSTLGKDFEGYFGPNGRLAAIPYTLVLARGTAISVQVDDEYRRTMESFVKGGGSLSFGPFFSAGGSYSKDEKSMKFKSTDDGFSLTDDEKIVRILAARVRRFNWEDGETKDHYAPMTEKSLRSLTREASQ
jgi:hypothetical protein